MSPTPETPRKVGFEIEFGGTDAAGAARVLAAALGGEVAVTSPHLARVTGSRLGTLKLELDTRYAKPAAGEPDLIDRALDSLDARDLAADMLSYLAPIELVTEPLAPDRFDVLDEGLAALAEAGFEGTKAATLNAYGMHLNVQLVPPEPARAIRVGAAYAFAEHWVRAVLRPDNARRASPFIDPYPAGYLRALGHDMAGGRVPKLDAFVALYEDWNPNRNRGLDLWPLLGHLASDTCARLRGRPVPNARPAFHYRLPDSRLGEPGWSPQTELARWDRIEAAAGDAAALEALRRASLDCEEWRTSRAHYLDLVGEVLG